MSVQHLSNNLMQFVGASARQRVLMFGPGLETRTSKIVRHILTDEHMHDLKCKRAPGPFKVTGMMPGDAGSLTAICSGCMCAQGWAAAFVYGWQINVLH
jgi:hypothetical protein